MPGEVRNPFLKGTGLRRRNVKNCKRENINGRVAKAFLISLAIKGVKTPSLDAYKILLGYHRCLAYSLKPFLVRASFVTDG